jgi:hypothetical protein
VDLLEAPQAPATPLSRSSCLAPQPARTPASPKVTKSQEVVAMFDVYTHYRALITYCLLHLSMAKNYRSFYVF